MWPLWALLPLCLLLCLILVLLYRRFTRNEAILRASRDRAQVDLQMIVHQAQKGKPQADGSVVGSVAPAQRLSSVTSLPPGPPSSAAWSEAGYEMTGDRLSGGMSRSTGPQRGLAPTSSAANSSVAYSQHATLQLVQTPSALPQAQALPAASASAMGPSGQVPAPSRVTSFAVPFKRSAPPTSAPAPPAKKAYTNPYLVFCREQRPLLPPSLSNKEREKSLSMQWKALSAAEKAVYRAQSLQVGGAPAPAPAPTMAPAPASVPSTSRQALPAAASMTDRWSARWKVKDAKAARPAASDTPATTHALPPGALIRPSYTPVPVPVPVPMAPAPAAPHHLAVPRTHLATPTRLPAPTQSANLGLEQLQLAELVEHMSAEEALEVVGEAGLGTALDMLQRPRDLGGAETALDMLLQGLPTEAVQGTPPHV